MLNWVTLSSLPVAIAVLTLLPLSRGAHLPDNKALGSASTVAFLANSNLPSPTCLPRRRFAFRKGQERLMTASSLDKENLLAVSNVDSTLARRPDNVVHPKGLQPGCAYRGEIKFPIIGKQVVKLLITEIGTAKFMIDGTLNIQDALSWSWDDCANRLRIRLSEKTEKRFRFFGISIAKETTFDEKKGEIPLNLKAPLMKPLTMIISRTREPNPADETNGPESTE